MIARTHRILSLSFKSIAIGQSYNRRHLFVTICAGTLGLATGGNICSWNWVGTKYAIDSAMSHKCWFLSWNRLRYRVLPSFSRESITPHNWFSQGIDSAESMPGVLKSLKIRAQSPISPHTKSINFYCTVKTLPCKSHSSFTCAIRKLKSQTVTSIRLGYLLHLLLHFLLHNGAFLGIFDISRGPRLLTARAIHWNAPLCGLSTKILISSIFKTSGTLKLISW